MMSSPSETNEYRREYYHKYYPIAKDKILRGARARYAKDKPKNRQYRKDYRDKHIELARQSYMNWQNSQPWKKRADMIARKLIPLKPTCEICDGIERLQRHHKDYGKPLEVLTLCNVCHDALEVIEPPIYTKQKEIRFYKGFEPVEVLDMPLGRRGQRWPCKVLKTGEVKNLCVGHLCYLPHKIKKTKKEMQNK